MSELTPSEIRAFLVSTIPPPLATIATLRPGGGPRAVPVWFLWDENAGTLMMMAYAASAWARDLKRDPRAAVAIAQQVPPYQTVIFTGSVRLRPTSKAESREDIERLARRYLAPAQVEPYLEDTLDAEQLYVTMVPEAVKSWSFEFRTG